MIDPKWYSTNNTNVNDRITEESFLRGLYWLAKNEPAFQTIVLKKLQEKGYHV